jgi:hypothetical protein
MLDFTLIVTGEDFELLCEDLLNRKGFTILVYGILKKVQN